MFNRKALREAREQLAASNATLRDAHADLTEVELQNAELRSILDNCATIYETGSTPPNRSELSRLYAALTVGREYLTATA